MEGDKVSHSHGGMCGSHREVSVEGDMGGHSHTWWDV